jgi:hypothetical protein
LHRLCKMLTASEVERVYHRCTEVYYGISFKDVKWVLSHCGQCKLGEPNIGKPALKPIKSNFCLERLVIDLMDLRGTPDGEYKWILQMKDHFSRFIWVYALKDKSSASVGKILKEWFCQNGYPKYW